MIKLIATDIDGTIFHRGKINPTVIQALKEAQDQGLKITLATGRNARSIQKILDQMGMGLNYSDIPIIGQNGAEVFTIQPNGDMKEEYNHFFTKEETDLLFKLANKHHVQIFSYAYNDKLSYVNKKWHPFVWALSHNSKRKPLKYDFVHPLKSPISKLIVSGSRRQMQKFREEVSNYNYPIFAFSYVQDARQNIEIVPKGVNKSEGLKFLAKKFNLQPEEVAYFGDGENDLEAIKWAGLGFAMGNAHDHIKKAADKVAPSVQENGVAVEINRLLEAQKNTPTK
ncbi:hypothetical protein JN01_0418 [Entomoplasma freundtii]|uniref:HAD superfamily hydrolase n=1 Tax=Entomoplasma freundtii TaxID=74700 RepID=A0A2K8NQS1_9MOLU|nr:HAD family hydrolase [Entomoplasma freundtii]ATZ16182.1 HAD superfamily hydrolase [Entomoplasma freundtii]TDY56917.1 hypothetical protein JN01_0418 [Entomoplasma freundtii]